MPDKRHTRWMKVRLWSVAFFLLLASAGLMLRMYTLQVVDAPWLQGLSRDQYLKEIVLEPMRGAILDRQGAPLAVSVPTDSIFADPAEIKDHAAAARLLAAALDLDANRLKEKLARRKFFAWIKRRVTPAESSKARALDLKGLHFTRESRRFYPSRELAGSIVGIVSEGRGLEGVELTFDGQLRGATVLAQGLRDARGNLLFADGLGAHETSSGGGVVLTIDLTIQEIVEAELQRMLSYSGARAASAIVMDPATGEILAMANLPTFNPNTFWNFNAAQWRNRAVTDCFEPGSTLKVFTAAAALQSGAVRPGELFDCEHGNYQVGNHVIHDSNREGYGLLRMPQILVHSSNIGAAKLGARLGRDGLYTALSRFGFGRRTGVELPGESACVLRSPQKWTDVDLATISFGQGVSVNSLQLMTAISAVANGGTWMRPLVVREIRGPKDEVIQRFEPDPQGRVLDAAHARALSRMLVAVTEPGGTGELAAVPGFQVAGKTGTAQKADPIFGGYSQEKRVASFMGYVPADNPRIAVLVVADEPKTSPYGGVVAAPSFARIAEATLRYLKVFPGSGLSAAVAARPLPVEARGESLPAVEVTGNRDSAGAPGTVPDVRGLSIREALQRVSPHGFAVKAKGSGRVLKQNPAPGTAVKPGLTLVLELERRFDDSFDGTEIAATDLGRSGN